MKSFTKIYRKVAVFGHRVYLVAFVEAILIVAAALFAFALRLDHLPPFRMFTVGVVPLVAIRLVVLWRYNLLRGWWRYSGFNEALDLAKAGGIGGLLFFLVYSSITRPLYPKLAWPYSVFLIESSLTMLFLGSARAAIRVLANSSNLRIGTKTTRLILVGAGDGAHGILRELKHSKTGFEVVACVDDDPTKQGLRIEGVTVQGTVDDLPRVAEQLRANEIWIATPSASSSQMNRLITICAECKLPYKSLPRLRDFVNGNIVAQVCEVRTSDLLGREPVINGLHSVRQKIQDKRVMVTGAAGSIGSELCWQLLAYNPAELICVDQSETGMFYLELKHREKVKETSVHYCVADISDVDRMRRIMTEHSVDIIFHAAAYKHVPLMETNVAEAVNNNVTALNTLLETADNCNVGFFVMISSDKAVNPTNVMGASKRIGELLITSRPQNGMQCVAVRFGNVLGSNGSVVPLFQEQIRRDNEVTITHPDIERYFMTIDEAVSLVLQAFTVGQHGDILVLDMGEPVRIVDLARNLIRLSGKLTDAVKIRYVGLRDGEKLKEELFYGNEHVWRTECHKVLRTHSAPKSWSQLSRMLQQLNELGKTGTDLEIKKAIKQIVPEYELHVSRRSKTVSDISKPAQAISPTASQRVN